MRKRVLQFGLAAVLAVSAFTLSLASHAQSKTSELPTITVLRFDGGGLELSRILTNTLSAELVNSKRFRVIEYEDISKVITHTEFENMGAVSTKEATKIGKMKGCNLVATGTVIDHEGPRRVSDGPLGDIGEKNAVDVTMTVNFKIIDPESGEIWTQEQVTGSAKDRLSNDVDADSLWRKAAINAAKVFVPKIIPMNGGCVIEVHEKDGIFINMGSKSGVNKDTEFMISRLGREIIDPTTGEVIGYNSDVICRARVISGSIQPKLCKIEPGEWKQRIVGFNKVWRWCKFDAKKMPEVKVNDKVEIVEPLHR